ncbi:MAG TPA: SDR family NAD(P)-dependent oxidoreductase, partial [Burkholderiales bacterium]|nr:SDR family NAD(P)-dependent oxidoreductase [Burkholderiales bacterium]
MKQEAEVIEASREETWRDRTRPVVPRIAFVSGGMGGIGSAICRRFAQSGHTVVAGCLPGYERKQEWLDAMRAQGFKVHAAEGDVAEFDSCAEMFYNVRSVVGPVDILVNNAGITRDSVFKRMTEQDWMAVINTNLNSVFNVTRQVVDGMCERGWGRVVNISSVNA